MRPSSNSSELQLKLNQAEQEKPTTLAHQQPKIRALTLEGMVKVPEHYSIMHVVIEMDASAHQRG